MIQAHPLQWPTGYQRSKRAQASLFGTSFARARDALIAELHLMKARNIVLSSNLALRRDGLPYANQSQPDDRGVAVYFTWQGESRVFACDRWIKVEDNVQALRKTVEALRGLERWGVSDMLNRMFTGFAAIEDKTTANWRRVLGLADEKPVSMTDVERSFRALMLTAHPDHGGSAERVQELQDARAAAERELSA